MNRDEVIEYALSLEETFEDYPFSDKKYGLFHDSIVNPADQLERLAEIQKDITY